MTEHSPKPPGPGKKVFIKEDGKNLSEYEQLLEDIINFLPDATLVIDQEHRVIAWNRAMEEMTGVQATDMLGRGDYAYSVPFYGEPRPLLADIVLKPNFQQEIEYDQLIWEKHHLSGEKFCPSLGFKGRYIYATSSPLYNKQRDIVGAVESMRDITERKEVERQLKESEAKFRTLAEATPGVFILQDDTFKYVNHRFSDLMECNLADLHNLAFWELVHPDDREFMKNRARARFQGVEVPKQYQYRALSRSGRVFWMDISVDVIEYEGRPAVIAAARNINPLREMEHALQQSEKKLRQILELTPGIIYILQRDRVRYANPTLCRKLGYSEEELLKLSLRDVIHPDHWEMVAERSRARQRGEDTPNRYELKLLTSSKEELWIDLTATMIEYEGKPAILGMANDVTATRQLRDAWENTENTFHSLTDTAPVLIYIIQGHRYRYINKFSTAIIGYELDELVDVNSLDLIHPDYRALVDSELRKLSVEPDNQVFRHDIKILPREGPEVWIDFSASLFQWEGKPAIIGAAYNVTHRKELEAALLQSENNFRLLAETAPVLIFLIQDNEFVYTNRLFSEVTGYTAQECLEMKPADFFDLEDRKYAVRVTTHNRNPEYVPTRHEGRIHTRDRSIVWADFNLTQITFNGRQSILGAAIDITDQKRAQLEIEYLNYHDKLTGLYNRAYLEEELKYLDSSTRLPISIIIGDVNGLKLVNDAFGHQSGDHMLQKVAQILKANCRKSDLVARWGGDEFVIILPQSREEVAWRICSQVYRDCTQMDDFTVPVSIALGVATKTDPEQKLEELFKEAEDLMYRNKMLENRSARSSFLNSLEQTLAVRSHETREHTQRLRQLVLAVGQSLHLLPDEMNSLTLLASLHDIGKIAIPNSILDKPAPLTEEEWDLMKKHPEIGCRIALSNPELAPIAEAILNHHEHWDGRGYPLGVKGPEIPLLSRILALADAFDVMVSGRPYQKALTPEEALKEIIRCSGTQFDPDLAMIFIEIIKARAVVIQDA